MMVLISFQAFSASKFHSKWTSALTSYLKGAETAAKVGMCGPRKLIIPSKWRTADLSCGVGIWAIAWNFDGSGLIPWSEIMVWRYFTSSPLNWNSSKLNLTFLSITLPRTCFNILSCSSTILPTFLYHLQQYECLRCPETLPNLAFGKLH